MQNSLSLEADSESRGTIARRGSPGPNELFEDHFEAVHRYFSRRIASADDAQDLTAETFAATVGAKIPRNVEPLSWLYGIAHRKLADHLRRQKRSNVLAPDQTCDPISARATAVREWVDALPSDQREALLLQALERLSVQQIAHVMHRSPGSVKALLQRAKERVRLESRMELQMEETR